MSLTALSPLDGRYAEKLNNLRPVLSEFGLIRARVTVELRWLECLANEPKIPEIKPLSNNALNVLNKIIDNLSEKDAAAIKAIEATINHDVKAVEYFIKEQFANTPELDALKEFVHFACTSEDINNLAYALMLKDTLNQHVIPTLTTLTTTIAQMANNTADQAMLSRTHGQPASPTTLGKELRNVQFRLERQSQALAQQEILGKINGAVGNFNAHCVAYPEIDWLNVSKNFVTALGLSWNSHTTQIEPHDYIAEIMHNCMRINTILIDFSRDMWGYIARDYFKQKAIKGEVGSSTMPHKINPIDFENAEGNLGIANALMGHLATKLPCSRWQRDLTDSTVLRNLGVAFGHTILSIMSLQKGLGKLQVNAQMMESILNDHWEVLAEAIQTVMRRHGLETPYEQLKTFTRGQKIDRAMLAEFIGSLNLPDKVKAELTALTPSTYLGNAILLANTKTL